ncbi:nitroreductase family protein [Herbiconiux daphne]|uniref:Nitroreductase family protein n=1 Tax=Herbiconiux daphne TaxID=2970914 RepID=A0ABT2H6C8_9MICO|nr:nitroreductase family protein [Herbiconiux daphne]MCS5735479.1 nitroreductase family protein [Herbiconiux daphne]
MTITADPRTFDAPVSRGSFDRSAETSAPIHPVLADRWSPRSFDAAAPIDETALTAALEAARWSPSAANSQPARFIVARRGTEAFDKVAATLMGFNSVWATSAAVLVVGVVATTGADGKPLRWAEYDLGQAMAHLSVQAHHDGLHVHQMGGFDVAAIAQAFDLDDTLTPVTVAAIGTLASPDALPDEILRTRESAPRTRLPLAELLLANE